MEGDSLMTRRTFGTSTRRRLPRGAAGGGVSKQFFWGGPQAHSCTLAPWLRTNPRLYAEKLKSKRARVRTKSNTDASLRGNAAQQSSSDGARNRISARTVTLLTLLSLAVAPLDAADWPRWRGPTGDGRSTEANLRTDWPAAGPPILWKAQAGTGFSSLAVAGGRVYTMGNSDDQDSVVCFDARTGETLWRHSYDEPLDPNLFEGGPTATPTVHEGRVYTFSRQGKAHCLDARTGQVVWHTDVRAACEVNVPSWGFASSPVLHGDLVLLNAGGAGTALNQSDGSIAWKSDNSDDAGYTTPVLATFGDELLALIVSAKSLNAVDPASGAVRWQFRWITRFGVNAADPFVTGERVLLTSGYSKGASLLDVSGAEPTEIWRTRDLRNQLSPGVLIDGHVYAVDGDAGDETSLKCVDFATGEVRWTHPGLGSATLIAAGNTLIALSEQGDLLLAPASPDRFAPVATARVIEGKCWTPPALADGLLYLRNATGDVVCVDLRP
jgi:outer membrane protein assembly factor BamB